MSASKKPAKKPAKKPLKLKVIPADQLTQVSGGIGWPSHAAN